MEIEAVNSFYYFSRQLNIPVTYHTVKDFLLSHPDYPSLASYADLCEHLKVEHIALDVSMEQLVKKDFPVVAHISGKKNAFFIVIKSIDQGKKKITYFHPNSKTVSEPIETFLKKWTKIVFYALPDEDSGEDNYFRKRIVEILTSFAKPIFIISLLLLLSVFLYQAHALHSTGSVLFLLLKMIGLFVSIHLVSHTLGHDTKISKMVCTQGKYTNCDDVLDSPASKLFGIFSLSDIGLVYFVGSIISILLSIYFNIPETVLSLLSLVAVFSLPYILFSIYYQAFILKTWCLFCLSVISILFMECLYFLFNMVHFDYTIISLTAFFVICFSFVATISF